MEKVVNFLEKNVQWLALGLSGVVLLLMVWSYVIQSPVKISVAGKDLTPGEIDAETVRGPVADYKRKVSISTPPDVKDVDFVGPFQDKMDPRKESVALLDRWGSRDLSANGGTIIDPKVPNGGPDRVAELPVPPAATFFASNNGRSVALVPDPKKKAAAAATAAAAAANPNARAARAADVDQVDNKREDKDWVTAAFDIPVDKLADAFGKVFDKNPNLPPTVYDTAIVHIELQRQERLADGKWGNQTIIKPLANMDQPEFPKDQKDQRKLLQYVQWVNEHAEQVGQPPFYEVAEADPWMPPGSDVVPAGDARPATPRQPMMPRGYPGGYPGMYPGGYPGMQRPGMYPGGARPPYGGGGYPGMYPGGYGPRPRPGGYAPHDAGRPIEIAQVPQRPPAYPGGYPGGGYGMPGYGRGGYPGMMPGGYGGYPGMMPGMMPGMAPGAMTPETAPGGFNVTTAQGNIRVWAHDDTVQDGKTYRYAIKYRIRNPLYTSNLGAKKEMNERFALESPLSNWSDPVKITPKVNFFVSNTQGNQATFEVFNWQKGKLNKTSVKAWPGDLISNTTWTVVDIRKDGTDSYVLLVNQGGQVVRRDRATDQRNPQYIKLRGEVENRNATAAADR